VSEPVLACKIRVIEPMARTLWAVLDCRRAWPIRDVSKGSRVPQNWSWTGMDRWCLRWRRQGVLSGTTGPSVRDAM
jgi:hypothetical protein